MATESFPPHTAECPKHPLVQAWQHAADGGDAHAQHELGEALLRGGPTCSLDLPLAVRYLQLAAAQGDRAAVTRLNQLTLGEIVRSKL